jgi:hypothetical protein
MERKKTKLIFLVLIVFSFLNANSQLNFSITSSTGSYSITCTHSAITLSASSTYTSPVTYTWSTPQLNTVISNLLLVSNPGVEIPVKQTPTFYSKQTPHFHLLF